MVLVARRAAALSDLAATIEQEHGAQTQVVALDLARPGSAESLHSTTAPLLGRVELLVANAGRSWSGRLTEQPADVLEQMLELNVATVARLCRLYAADFARHGRGALLLTSSLVSLAPLPHASLYGASRAFVRSLALGLRDECAAAAPRARGCKLRVKRPQSHASVHTSVHASVHASVHVSAPLLQVRTGRRGRGMPAAGGN